MTLNTPVIGQLYKDEYNVPLDSNGKCMPFCYRSFYRTKSTTQVQIYSDAALTINLPQPATADANGLMPLVYLDPSIQYRAVLFNALGQKLEDQDPVNVNFVATAVAATKLTTTSIVSNTTPAVDPDLQVFLPSAGTYRVELDIGAYSTTSGATPGFKFGLAYSGKLNIAGQNGFAVAGLLNGSQYLAVPTVNGVSATGSLSSATPTFNTMRWMGTIQVLTSGTLSFNWAQANSSATATNLMAGSTMHVTQIG